MTTLKTESNTSGGRNSVRIIAGTWRGRRVNFPDIAGLRPTPDRVRETLFNWLQKAIAGSRCLDLFAGSGALGLEALSRGAKEVVFVEQAVAAARALQEQLTRLGGGSRGRVVEMGATRYLRTPVITAHGAAGSSGADGDGTLRGTPYGTAGAKVAGASYGLPNGIPDGVPYGVPFDIVFLDPPFGRDFLAEYVPMLDSGNWLNIGGLVYLENEKTAGVPALPPHWELLKSKSAGEVGYHLARVNARV